MRGAFQFIAGISFDLATMAVRTFVLGHSVRSQLAEIQEEDAE